LKTWPVLNTKSSGDAFLGELNLREWIKAGLKNLIKDESL
jgi:hypothetical protein